MRQLLPVHRLLPGLLAAALLAGPFPVAADPAAECRQEVQDYGIPPEQAQDYIDGCILSRGGVLEADPAGAAAVDMAMPQGDEYREGQVFDAGQSGEMLPGGSDGAY
jgi:hypothetical protein